MLDNARQIDSSNVEKAIEAKIFITFSLKLLNEEVFGANEILVQPEDRVGT